MNSSFKDVFRSFKRSWVHHTGMQLATLSVLAATFSVIIFVFSLSLNFKRVLISFGDGVQMSVYLEESLEDSEIAKLEAEFKKLSDVSSVVFVPRETATENFKKQMASYAPDLLTDADFANPFPASFRLALKKGIAENESVDRLEIMAERVRAMPGVEDLSYGESWVRNYSSFVSALQASGGIMALILIAGSLFVIGNSIHSSISARRDEIEILELVGATASMIRWPFITEGLVMGAVATVIAIGINFGLYLWQKSVLSSSLALARLLPMISFMDVLTVVLFVMAGSALGAMGAWITVRRINDGWSASQGLES